MTNPTPEDVEAVFVIECSRCSFERVSYADDKADALDDFVQWGWVRDAVTHRIYCSHCWQLPPRAKATR